MIASYDKTIAIKPDFHEAWRTACHYISDLAELPLRLMATTLKYKYDRSQRQRFWLQLPQEERSILDQALQIDRG